MIRDLFPGEYIQSVFVPDYQKLYDAGYRGIIFDIDNTLVHHGDPSTPEIDALFEKIHKTGLKTLLLTNNDEERIGRFITNIDTLYIAEAGKPAPESYIKAIEMMGIKKSEALFMGDQIFTDILGANKSGTDNILVKFIRMPEEKKIGKKRYIEKVIIYLSKILRKRNPRLTGILYDKKGDTESGRKREKAVL